MNIQPSSFFWLAWLKWLQYLRTKEHITGNEYKPIESLLRTAPTGGYREQQGVKMAHKLAIDLPEEFLKWLTIVRLTQKFPNEIQDRYGDESPYNSKRALKSIHAFYNKDNQNATL